MVTIVTPPLIFWLGVKYSASYINKTYVVQDPKEIALLSTIYLVIIGGGYRLHAYIYNVGVDVPVSLAVFIVGAVVFYISSKTYIKSNTTNSETAPL